MIIKRLELLRNAMKKNNLDLYYFNTTDYHLSEYVPAYFKTLAYFSGFTGSLASFLISLDDAYIFVDGRYHIQADNECLKYGIKVIKLGVNNALDVIDFIKQNYPDKVLGIDGKRTAVSFMLRLNDIKIKNIDIYSDLIENREMLKNAKIYELKQEYVGISTFDKLEIVKQYLEGKTHIISNLESIAYLTNCRSSDVINTPVFLAYMIFLKQEVYLFVDSNRLEVQLFEKLTNSGIIIKKYQEFYDFIKTIKNQTITLDDNKNNYDIYEALEKDNELIFERSYVENMKAIKNEAEQNGARIAHIYDGIAYVRFLKWFDSVDKSLYDEYQIAQKISKFRLEYKANDLSFAPIVAYEENSAINHYSPSKDACKKLDNKGVLLLDTGGQYYEGTTDITRTIALGEVSDNRKRIFCSVLSSMFNLSEFKFMKGLTMSQLDPIARADIWALGLDYRHGTGHGVGSFLSVHETPPNISFRKASNGMDQVVMNEGMIFSDEPGIYFDNDFGVRCENLLLCKPFVNNEFGEFLEFETLTLVPFDLKMIDKKYLDQKTIVALNNYHQKVYDTLSPYLTKEEADYLKEITKTI